VKAAAELVWVGLTVMSEVNLVEALRSAIQHHQAGRLPEAEALYREVLGRDPDCIDALHYLGVIALQVGQHAVAADLVARAAALAPGDPGIHSNLGEIHRHLHRPDEAVASFRRALALDPRHHTALNNLGNILVAQGKLDEAASCFRRALAVKPDSLSAHHNLGNLLAAQGRPDEAIACLQKVVAVRPDLAEVHYHLGNLLQERGRAAEAIVSFQQALAQKPDFAEAHNNLGNAYLAQGRFEEALPCFRQALTLQPDFATAHYNLGTVHLEQGRGDEAIACFRRTLALQPDFADAHNNLGNLYKEQGRYDEARASFQQALALKPDFAEGHNNLGSIHSLQDRLDEALACFQRALALKPDLAEAHINLGTVYKDRGQLDEALACYHRALTLKPDRADIHSNIVLTLYYHAGLETGAIAAEQRRWNEQHGRPSANLMAAHPNDRSPDRRLRIGYVSPDFCAHPVGLNLLPLFRHHAHDQVEIFCYAHVPAPDAITAEFRAGCDHWHDVSRLSDADLAGLIRRDQIDLLVDLALHTARNRLPVFALKPALVQVSFAGYPAATGLETIDYHLTDPHLTPSTVIDEPGPDAAFRLPDTFWCYDPRAEALAVGPLPALAGGRVTFGCLNNVCKLNDAVVQLWARVLLAVPGARLLLLAPRSSRRQHILDRFEAAGIPADRIEFADRQPREKYLALYQRIDLGLDTFPYNGHTTSLDSYWMGVPVVTLVGQTSVARAGWSQLSNLGLTELAARTPGEFVTIAATLARDLPRLAALRSGLRERMRRSPLMDGPRFARAIEAAYRTMWRRWCG
jgi:protein O-GlcNAc transferase